MDDTYEIAAQADDGGWYGSTFKSDGYGASVGYYSSNTAHAFFRWDNVILPPNAVISAAVVRLYVSAKSGNSYSRLYFADAADPIAPTSAATANAITKTTAYTQYNYAGTPAEWVEIDALDEIRELLASYDYSSPGAAMVALLIGSGVSNNYTVRQWGSTSQAYLPQLKITWDLPCAAGPQIIGLRRR